MAETASVLEHVIYIREAVDDLRKDTDDIKKIIGDLESHYARIGRASSRLKSDPRN